MVQGQVGAVVADHAAHAHCRNRRSRSRRSQARFRCDDADEKDRHRSDRSGPARLTLKSVRLRWPRTAVFMIEQTPNPSIELTSSGKLRCLQPELMSNVRQLLWADHFQVRCDSLVLLPG